MPQAIPAAVAWASAAFSSAVTATSVALTSLGATAVLGEGATIALASTIVKTAAITALSAAAAAIMRPSVPDSGTTLDFKPDPKAPIRGAMGYTALGGNKVFQATWGYKGVAMSLGVALSLGPIDQITQFRADDSVVTFSGSQSEATGYFAADMWQTTTKGLPTDAALLPPTGLKYGNPPLTGWGGNNSAKGTAFAFWTMVLAKNPEDRDIFVNGVPDPRWIGRWMKVYDWRKDDTYPGGSGSQREGDWTTWEFSENPYVHARHFIRGHYKMNTDGSLDYTKRIAGVGAPVSAIDMAAFTEGANVADANDWKISGEWTTNEQKWQVIAAMLQAGGGQVINRGAQISVLVNTPRVSTYTYTREDMVGQAQVDPLTRRRDRKNTIIPRYRSEANGWEYVAAGDVTSSVYREEDRNEPRSTEIQYSYVRLAKQAGQLAAYDLANLREGITVTLPSKVHLMSVHAGDCITINVPDMALASQKVIVMRTTTDYKNATVTLECRSETDGKHAFALGQAANPPPSPSLSRVDPYYIPPPIADEWAVEVKPPVGGVDQPIIIVDGTPGTSDVASVVVEYGLSNTGPWLSAGPLDPASNKYQISGLNSGAQYWISIQYVSNNGAISDRYISGPHTVGILKAADVIPTAPSLVAIDGRISEVFDATAILSDDLDAAEVLIGNVSSEVTAARQGQPNLGARITQVNQSRIDGDETLASQISIVAATANLGVISSGVIPAIGPESVSYFTQGTTGSPQTAPDYPASLIASDASGNYLIVNSTASVRTKAAPVRVDGRKIRFKVKASSSIASGQVRFRARGLSGDYLSTTGGPVSTISVGTTVSEYTSGIIDLDTITGPRDFVRYEITALDSDIKIYAWEVEDVTEVVRLDASVATVNQARIDGDANNASAINAVQLEVSNARQGQPNLAARITQVNQARVDGDASNATAIANTQLEVTNARQGQPSLSAKITQVDTSIASEATARATAINNVSAQIDGVYQGINPTFAAWSGTEAIGPDFWVRYNSGNVTVSRGPTHSASPWSMRNQSVSTANTGMMQDVPAPVGGEWIAIEADFVVVSGNIQGSGVSFDTLNASGTQIKRQNINFFTEVGSATAGKIYRVRKLVDARIAGATTYRIYAMTRLSTFAPVGAVTIDWVRLSFRSATEEEIAAETVLPALQASVTQNTLAIVDIEGKQALASYEVVAAASGGKPARLRLVSSSLGSAVALDAPWIYFGDNTVFDDATDTLQTTVGSNRRVIAWGLPFGTDGNLLEWWGPASVAVSAMNAANGYNGRTTTAPYVFDNASAAQFRLISSSSTASGTRSGAGVVTSSSIDFTLIGAVGPVEFSAYNAGGDPTMVATNPTAIDSSSPFQFITAFRATVGIAESKLSRFAISARDANGNTTTAFVQASLAETT